MSPLKISTEQGVDKSRYSIDNTSKGIDYLSFPLTLEPEERLTINDLVSLAKIVLVSATKGGFGGYVNGLLLGVGKKAEINGLIIEGVKSPAEEK